VKEINPISLYVEARSAVNHQKYQQQRVSPTEVKKIILEEKLSKKYKNAR
jgi:hypothetical protein